MDDNVLPETGDEAAPVKQDATRKHLRGSSILLLGRIISLGLNFGVQVLTIRYLTKSDYGAFAYALTIVSIATSVSLFKLEQALSRYVPIFDEREDSPSVIGTMIVTFGAIVGLGLALVALVFAFHNTLRESVDSLSVSLLLILIALAPLGALDNWFQSMFAIFASPKAIFFRRHILGPGLKLAAVLAVIVTQNDVYFLAYGYLIGGVLGTASYLALLVTALRKKGIFDQFNLRAVRLPIREIFTFSTPLLYSDVVFILRNNLVVVVLEQFHQTTGVADFRAMTPFAGLNVVVLESFTFLYIPQAARLFARDDKEGINDLYWKTAAWISILSFPVFVVTFSLARPLVLLFDPKYAASSPVLAVLALGSYFNAALGFNAHTLRVYGRIRYTVIIDFLAACTAVLLMTLLIPPYGAMGAAISTAGTLIVHNLLNHTGLFFGTDIQLFRWKYLRVYATIALGAAGVLLVDYVARLPLTISIFVAAAVSILIVLVNRSVLDVADTFPELLRLPFMKRLLVG